VITLKRKFIHAVTTKAHSESVVQKLLHQTNPHEPGQFFTEMFFRVQWERQRTFEMNQNETDLQKKEERAQFWERGEALKSLA
jgi:hypothetical protein